MYKKLSAIILISFCSIDISNHAAFGAELLISNNSQPVIKLQPVALNGYEPMAVPKSFEPDYSCLTMGEMLAMVAGAIVGGASADFILGSAPFTVVSIMAGAALGSLAYRFGL